MSQSDYIKYKKTVIQLKLDMSNNKMPVFESQKYTDFKKYALESTIKNTKPIYNKLTPSGDTIIFDMEVSNSGCPTTVLFPFCINTNNRANRQPMSSAYFTPTAKPLNWQQLKNASNQKNVCSCTLNSKNTNVYICKCKLGAFGQVR
jgi:hypothetical protein